MARAASRCLAVRQRPRATLTATLVGGGRLQVVVSTATNPGSVTNTIRSIELGRSTRDFAVAGGASTGSMPRPPGGD